jgi:hypothetical protein
MRSDLAIVMLMGDGGRVLPSGMVTFLFTDVENSTRMIADLETLVHRDRW